MILSKDINPERNLYFLGGRVLQELQRMHGNKIDFLELYQKLNKEKDISVQLFVLTIDWLFLLEVVKSNKKGEIEKCF